MTSLSEQLRRLAIPAAGSTDVENRASLLFDPKKAATLDRDTFFALGVNGLEELASIDATIHEEFYETFFSETAKNTERTVLSQKDNDWLDKRIQSLLFRIAPYFLLRPAQKCLEWMIHRFRIHSFNVDEIFRAFLPYHETNIFVKLVQTLDISHPTNKWCWIAPIQKPGVGLAKATIFMHCKKDAAFLQFVCDMVPKAIKAHTVLPDPSHAVRSFINFYATITVSMVNNIDTISDKVLAQLVPYFIKGLRSRLTDYKAATYMIICQMATKATLTEQVVASLLKSLCKHRTDRLKMELLTTVVVICQTQENIISIPKKSFEELCEIPDLANLLENLHGSHDIDRFLTLFLKRLVPTTFIVKTGVDCTDSDTSKELLPEKSDILLTIIQTFEVSAPLRKLIMRLLVEDYVSLDDELPEKSSKILQQVQRKYPEEFDSVIADLSSNTQSDKSVARDRLNKFITFSVESAKYQNVADGDASIVLSLCHPEPAVRMSAIQHFASMFPVHPSLVSSEFVRDSIKHRLSSDDAPCVILEVLKLVNSYPAILFHDLESACHILIRLIYKNRNDPEWDDVSLAALTLMVSNCFAECSDQTRCLIVVVVYDIMLRDICTDSESSAYNIAVRSSYVEKNTDILFTLNPEFDVDSIVCGISSAIKKTDNPQATMAAIFEASSKMSEILSADFTDVGRGIHLASHYTVIGAAFLLAEDRKTFGADFVRLIHGILSEVVDDTKALLGSCRGSLPNRDMKIEVDSTDFFKLNVAQAVMAHEERNMRVAGVATLNVSLSLVKKCFEMLGRLSQSMQPLDKPERYWDGLISTNTDEEAFSFDGFYQTTRHRIFSSILDFVRLSETVGPKQSVAVVKKLTQCFLTTMFASEEDVLFFLAPYWCGHTLSGETSSPAMKVQTIYLGNAMLCAKQLTKKCVDKILSLSSPLIPSLLIAMASDIQAVRKAALVCLSSCAAAPHKYALKELVEDLVHHKEEIQTDSNSVTDVLAAFFSAEASPKRRSGRTPGSSSMLNQLLTNHLCNELAPMHLRASLLKILSKVNCERMFLHILPTLERLLSASPSVEAGPPDVNTMDQTVTSETIGLDCSEVTFLREGLLKIEPEYLSVSKIKSMFLRALSHSHEVSGGERTFTPQLLTLGMINRAFFAGVPSSDLQQDVLCCMLDIGVQSEAASTITAISKAFKAVKLDGSLVVTELNKLLLLKEARANASVSKPKRSRLQNGTGALSGSDTEGEGNPHVSKTWKRTILLLELLQHKKKIFDALALFAPLFDILDYVLEKTSEKNEEVEESALETFEYVKQLILTTLLNLIQKLKSKSENEEMEISTMSDTFKVELLVHCVRSTENSQTQQHALLLLSEVAVIFPEKVLHNVMAIFTFMGSHLLRQDDAYSFQVISSTIRTIIPALMKSKVNNNVSAQDTILKILRVFADSLLHIPAHRRLTVFEELLHTLGDKEHLWVMLVLLVDQYSCNPTSGKTQTDEDISLKQTELEFGDHVSPLTAAMEIWSSICDLSSPQVQVDSLICHLTYLLTLADDNDVSDHGRRRIAQPRTKNYSDVINVRLRSVRQLRRFKLASLTFFSHILEIRRSKFAVRLNEVERESQDEGDEPMETMDTTHEAAKMTVLFQRLFEKVLDLIHSADSNKDLRGKGSDLGSEKYYKAVTHKAYEVMHKINHLLPMNTFLLVVGGLLKHDSVSTRRKALELFAERINFIAGDFQQEEIPLVLGLAEELIAVASKSAEGNAEEKHEQNMLRYSSLLTLKLVIRSCAKLNPDTFVAMLSPLGKFVSNSKTEDTQVLSASLLCLAEQCTCLKAYCIPHLSSFVPSLIQLTCTSQALQNEALLFSCVTATHRLLENLPNFLSPYLDGIISKIAALSLLNKYHIDEDRQNDSTNDMSAQIGMRLKAITMVLATKIPSRVLVPSLQQCQEKIELKRPKSIKCLSTVAHRHVVSLDKEGISQNGNSLVNFFMELLDFRTKKNGKMTMEEIDEIENHVLEAMIAMMLKFSENTFRPLFFKLFDWACLADNPSDRLITYYKLMFKLADKMKGLFALFAGHLLANIAEILKENHKQNESEGTFSGQEEGHLLKRHLLLRYICDVLRTTMLHDTTGFVTKDRFELLLNPVVDQLENIAAEDGAAENELNEALVNQHVIPCLGQLAASVADDICWKPFNYQILLKSRHSSPKVRFAALEAIQEVAEKLGEDYTILLPESVPFLAELMEDDEEVVEKKCHDVIRRLEKVLGEPLQKYF